MVVDTRVGAVLDSRARLVSLPDRPILPRDLVGTFAWAGADPTLTGRDLQGALRRVIASRHGYCEWMVGDTGWVVMLLSPEDQTFSGKMLEEALAGCLVWLMFPALGVGPFLVHGQRCVSCVLSAHT
jgi:hypothetical protein